MDVIHITIYIEIVLMVYTVLFPCLLVILEQRIKHCAKRRYRIILGKTEVMDCPTIEAARRFCDGNNQYRIWDSLQE